MKDALLLRDRIAAALVCAPFIASGCAKDERGTPPTSSTSTSTSTSPAASGGPVASPSATVVPETQPSTSTSPPIASEKPSLPPHGFPPCPGGQFCAPASKMKAISRKGSESKIGCPTSVDASKDDAVSKDVPSGPGIAYQFSETDTTAKQAAGDKTACCYHWMRLCPGGRPLLDDVAHPITAAVSDGVGWLTLRPELANIEDAGVRAALARAWLEDACMEHASIASFARTTLELLSVGAPSDLVRDAQSAGLEEIRHAERCFELASFYAGRDLEPGPLPLVAPRAPNLTRLARDTFIEGCVGETISALVAMRAVEIAPYGVAAVWRMLAAQEARHAELAWLTLAWISERDTSACAALRDLARELEADVLAPLPEAPALPGRLSSSDLDAVRRDAWRLIITPTLQRLLPSA